MTSVFTLSIARRLIYKILVLADCYSRRYNTAGNMASSGRNPNMAIPLCLPNNYRWNATTGKCSKTAEERSSLVIVDEALQKLRTLKGKLFQNWPLPDLQ